MRVVPAIVALLFIALPVSAEIYMGILPNSTLGDVKARFPHADYRKIKPAWAQASDAVYEISGVGLSGTIIINFYDARPYALQLLDEVLRKNLNQDTIDSIRSVTDQPDDSALRVIWVRWAPDKPFPVQRLISKYGIPEVSGFSEIDFQPYRAWKKKGLTAVLSDDEKDVFRIDFFPTPEDLKSAADVKTSLEDAPSSSAPTPGTKSTKDMMR